MFWGLVSFINQIYYSKPANQRSYFGCDKLIYDLGQANQTCNLLVNSNWYNGYVMLFLKALLWWCNYGKLSLATAFVCILYPIGNMSMG